MGDPATSELERLTARTIAPRTALPESSPTLGARPT